MPSTIPVHAPRRNKNHFIAVKNPPPPGHQGAGESGFRRGHNHHLALVDQQNQLRYHPCTSNCYAKVLRRAFFREFEVEFRTTRDEHGVIMDINPVEKKSDASNDIAYDVLVTVDMASNVVVDDAPNAEPEEVGQIRDWFEKNIDRRITVRTPVGRFRVTHIEDDGEARYYLSSF